MATGGDRLGTFAAGPGECSETTNAGIQSLYFTSTIKPKPNVCIESMPSEMLLKIFSYLDPLSLLSVGCVNKHFYDLASDNLLWLKLYSSSLLREWEMEEMKSQQTETVSLGCAGVHDKKPGYWKKEYIFKQTSYFTTRVAQLAKPPDPYTGLPCMNNEVMKVYGLSWTIVLKDKNGKEHVMEKPKLSFKDTSVTMLWCGRDWPCLDILSTLKLFGVTPLLPDQSRPPSKKGPRRFALLAEYSLANLTESSVALGADELVQLFSLNPGLLVGTWKEKNEIAFIMASLHSNQLLERSVLGSAAVQCAPPPREPLLGDTDPEYGLHDYRLHLELHGGSCMYLWGTYNRLFGKKDDIENGYLRFTVANITGNRKHWHIFRNLGICWETDVFKGNVKDCFLMDLTLLDETRKPFWCFSAPVYMELSSKLSALCDYTGPSYTADYADSEGKVCIKFVWFEETKTYVLVSLVLYVSTKKINSWYGTNY